VVKVLPPARLALSSSAAWARVISAVILLCSVVSAPVARDVSAEIVMPSASSAAPARVTSPARFVVSVASAASARVVSAATELLEEGHITQEGQFLHRTRGIHELNVLVSAGDQEHVTR